MRLIAAFVVGSLLVAACGEGAGGDPTTGGEGGVPLAVVASSSGSIGIGRQRIMFSVLDRDSQELLADPEREATVEVRDENGSPLGSYSTEFLWTVEGSRGLYVAYLDLPEPGTYQAVIEVEGLATPAPVGFVATEDPKVVQVGVMAPKSQTRTSADTPDLALISSDPEPDPDFYRLSIDEAVSNGTPTVIVFATPAWCVSQTCGPLLDQAKSLSNGFPGVDFVHAEIYADIQVESFDDLTTIEAVAEWGLPSEPWIFVVDGSGQVTATFEGVVSDVELSEAISAVAG